MGIWKSLSQPSESHVLSNDCVTISNISIKMLIIQIILLFVATLGVFWLVKKRINTHSVAALLILLIVGLGAFSLYFWDALRCLDACPESFSSADLGPFAIVVGFFGLLILGIDAFSSHHTKNTSANVSHEPVSAPIAPMSTDKAISITGIPPRDPLNVWQLWRWILLLGEKYPFVKVIVGFFILTVLVFILGTAYMNSRPPVGLSLPTPSSSREETSQTQSSLTPQ